MFGRNYSKYLTAMKLKGLNMIAKPYNTRPIFSHIKNYDFLSTSSAEDNELLLLRWSIHAV